MAGILAIVLTAAYILYKIMQYLFLGEFSEERWRKIYDASRWPFKVDMASFELVTMAPLLVGIIVIGIWPSFILDTINATSVIILEALPS